MRVIVAACRSKTIQEQAIQDILPLDRLNACHPHVLIILGDIVLLPLLGVMGMAPLASGTLVLRRVIWVLVVVLPVPPRGNEHVDDLDFDPREPEKFDIVSAVVGDLVDYSVENVIPYLDEASFEFTA